MYGPHFPVFEDVTHGAPDPDGLGAGLVVLGLGAGLVVLGLGVGLVVLGLGVGLVVLGLSVGLYAPVMGDGLFGPSLGPPDDGDDSIEVALGLGFRLRSRSRSTLRCQDTWYDPAGHARALVADTSKICLDSVSRTQPKRTWRTYAEVAATSAVPP